jgi:toxin CcdB
MNMWLNTVSHSPLIGSSDGAPWRASHAWQGVRGIRARRSGQSAVPLATRIVVPLLPEKDAPKPINDLNPAMEFGGALHVMVTQAIASSPVRHLKDPVASLARDHDRVLRALDFLLVGF